MGLDAFKFIFMRPFQWREFLEQSWFVARVSLAPTLLVAIPFTVLVQLHRSTSCCASWARRICRGRVRRSVR